jgi:hypothetical protein
MLIHDGWCTFIPWWCTLLVELTHPVGKLFLRVQAYEVEDDLWLGLNVPDYSLNVDVTQIELQTFFVRVWLEGSNLFSLRAR